MLKKLLFIVLSFVIFLPLAFALETKTGSPVEFSDRDRVLVIAPHPDDETIGAGGAIQQAIKAGAKVKVCLMTQGENNEFAFVVYEKRLVVKPKEFLRLGEVRRGESLDALKSLGVAESDVVSLGYPDYGLMELFLKYWGDVKPFRSMLSRVRKVPYAEALSPSLPYTASNALKDLKGVIESFGPTKVFVSHPADVNRDHRAVFLFTKVAIWSLVDEHKIYAPEIYPYLIHIPGWPTPRGYHPELDYVLPKGLDPSTLDFKINPLKDLEVGKKYDAVLKYSSQIKYAPRYLVTFSRRDEFYGDFFPIKLEKQMASDSEIVWSNVLSPNDPKNHITSNENNHFATTAFARQGNYLVVKLLLRRSMDKDLGISVTLLGYSPTVPFDEMPKISLIYNLSGFFVKDKKKSLSTKDVMVINKDKELIFKVPLTLLGNPARVLSSAKTALYDLTFDETPWRVLELP